MLTISKTLLSKIETHGEATYPDECCGALIGTLNPETGDKVITKIVEMDNISDENKKRRFMIKPEEYKRVETVANEEGLQLLGFYHSHPDHPAKPSETDLKFAWPFFSYFITSIQKGKAQETFSYALDLDLNQFGDEPITIN